MADLANYVVATFGHGAATIDADRVHDLRTGGATSPLLLLARGGMALGVMLVIVVALAWRRRRKMRGR